MWVHVSIALASILAVAQVSPIYAQAAPPRVTVAAPLERRIDNWDEYWGRFEAVASVEVRPRVAGFIDKIHFTDGQMVKEGDLLYTIDQRPFRIAVESAEAEVTRATAQVDLAANEVERARPLLKSAAVTERDFDQRQAALSVTRAQLLGLEAALRNAKLNLEWSEIRAPIAGRISDSKADIGTLVTAGTGATLLTTIVSLDPIHFVFDAAEADYLRYTRLGLNGSRPSSRETANPVKVKLADETGWPHEGKMDFVDNQINARSGTIRARAILPNTDQLLTPGLFGRLRLFGGETDALLVPDSAIVSDQMRKLVYVVGSDGTVQGVPVTLGQMDSGLRIVTGGLKGGESVIIEGLANPFVRPGTKVSAEPGEIKAAALSAN